MLIHNESLQVKLLEAEIARRQYKAEKGIFEPAVVGSFEHVENERENTAEQAAALASAFFGNRPREFWEDNDLYNGGLEFLSPVGSRFRVGYNMRRLHNSVNDFLPNSEYVTTVGVTVTQPLLKNFGTAATMARIRLAALNSDMAYQDYRRQLMLTVSRAEAAYWDLYFSQEQDRISQESVALAESIYKDNKSRLEVGKSSELEVLQAEAGVSLRRSRRSDAGQRLAEAANQLSTLFSGSTLVEHLLAPLRFQLLQPLVQFQNRVPGGDKIAFPGEHAPDNARCRRAQDNVIDRLRNAGNWKGLLRSGDHDPQAQKERHP